MAPTLGFRVGDAGLDPLGPLGLDPLGHPDGVLVLRGSDLEQNRTRFRHAKPFPLLRAVFRYNQFSVAREFAVGIGRCDIGSMHFYACLCPSACIGVSARNRIVAVRNSQRRLPTITQRMKGTFL